MKLCQIPSEDGLIMSRHALALGEIDVVTIDGQSDAMQESTLTILLGVGGFLE